VTIPEIIDQIVELILEDLDMRKLSAMWVPECLNEGQKRQRCQLSEQHLEFFRGDLNDFLSRLVTINETWFCHNDPETMQQSMDWRLSGSPRNKNFRVQKSARKVVALNFWNQDGIFVIDYHPKNQNISTEC
jgi:spore coat polysaccharide biosynthesis protein SpsF (cytidylyltransferase family)